MKARVYNIINTEVRENCINEIIDLSLEKKVKVTISDPATKSQRQRGLQWMWYYDVANSGIGGNHESTALGVHIISKYRFALPIFLRDDEYFNDLYTLFKQSNPVPDKIMWFIDTMVHTEQFTTSQMAEYLKDFEIFYLNEGVNLKNPDLIGMEYK